MSPVFLGDLKLAKFSKTLTVTSGRVGKGNEASAGLYLGVMTHIHGGVHIHGGKIQHLGDVVQALIAFDCTETALPSMKSLGSS